MATNTRLDDSQFEKLDLKLNGINGAINRLSDNVGKWLAIIAESAASDPELKAKIREMNPEE